MIRCHSGMKVELIGLSTPCPWLVTCCREQFVCVGLHTTHLSHLPYSFFWLLTFVFRFALYTKISICQLYMNITQGKAWRFKPLNSTRKEKDKAVSVWSQNLKLEMYWYGLNKAAIFFSKSVVLFDETIYFCFFQGDATLHFKTPPLIRKRIRFWRYCDLLLSHMWSNFHEFELCNILKS